MLRLFFHNCMVGGCDTSILVTSNTFNKAERDAAVNLPLSGDGFDAVARAKGALELECPGIASCADTLAAAAHNLVIAAGGPAFELRLGRKDSLASKATDPENLSTISFSSGFSFRVPCEGSVSFRFKAPESSNTSSEVS